MSNSVLSLLIFTKSGFRVISLFLIPTGSAHRSVQGLFGFTKRRSDWLTCVRLWRANPEPTLSRIQINTGNTRRRQRDERGQRDVNKRHFLFRLKKQGIPCLFQRPRTVLCSPTWDVKQSTVLWAMFRAKLIKLPVLITILRNSNINL